MLSIAKNRPTAGLAAQQTSRIQWQQRDVSDLSFLADGSVHVVSIGFGLRNVVEREKCLGEIFRVLKNGGVFVNLDLGRVPIPVIRQASEFVFKKIVPMIGARLQPEMAEMYHYLPNSNNEYYTQSQLRSLLLKTGFSSVDVHNHVFGQVARHIALK